MGFNALHVVIGSIEKVEPKDAGGFGLVEGVDGREAAVLACIDTQHF
jgi:hypothetical protein